MISSGIAWNDIKRMVKEEQKANNQFASLIYDIDFTRNTCAMMLDAVDEDDENSLQIDDQFIGNFD